MSPMIDAADFLANAMFGCLLKGVIEELQQEGWQPVKPELKQHEKVLYLTDSASGKLPVWLRKIFQKQKKMPEKNPPSR